MSQSPDHSRNVSLKLSEVLSDIGVNEKVVMKRRRMWLMKETVNTILYRLEGINKFPYYFGSQTEASTTMGLQSDQDILLCINNINLIQDEGEFKPGMMNVLMIQDETTYPGYCLLQLMWPHLPNERGPHIPMVTDTKGRVLLNNSILNTSIPERDARNGPAFALQGEQSIYCVHVHVSEIPIVRNGPALSFHGPSSSVDLDMVGALHCKSWPREAQPWLARQGIGGWPSEEMKRFCFNSGCFAVPVGSKSGQNAGLEWRISTSKAERYLMFCLNITQLRCYILMKMILKTFINPQCNRVISSYMCKTVLFHCIQNTPINKWLEDNLLSCLRHCLLALQHCIKQRKCPHFITPQNNLMAGRISVPIRNRLLGLMQYIIQSNGQALLEIPIDDLGSRLRFKINTMPVNSYNPYDRPEANLSCFISMQLLLSIVKAGSNFHRRCLNTTVNDENERVHLRVSKVVLSLAKIYSAVNSNSLEKATCRLLIQPLCSLIGSVIASSNIHANNMISPQALEWFSVGFDSDVSSGRLKLASALYCTGDMDRTETVLRNTEDQYDQDSVEPVCCCYNHTTDTIAVKLAYFLKSNTGNEEMIQHIMAFCVKFMRSELDCVPKELQYELFRSTEDDRLHRNRQDDWMDLAVVDSLPFIYFLQYKTYGHLQRAEDQQRALTNFTNITYTERNLSHLETALNLLGQCMEQENQHSVALGYYMRSLKVRPRNNAAQIHICRLLNTLVYRHLVEKK